MNNKKVALINHNLGPGGVSKYVYDLARKYKEKGLSFSVIALTGGDDIYGKELLKQDIEVLFLSGKTKIYDIRYIRKLIQILKNYDIIHVNTFPSQFWTACASIFLANKLYILTEHSTTNNRREKWWFKYIDKWMYKRYSKIISVSNEVNKNLQDWLTPSKKEKSKFIVINNGVDLDRYSKVVRIKRQLINPSLTNDQVLICMLARFAPPKDQKTLIRSMTRLDDKYKLLLLGSGDQSAEIQLVKDLNIEDKVIFLDYRLDADSLVKSCDISILSSNFEGLPLVVIEAMAMGIPTIGSDVDGLRDVMQDGGLLFECGNDEELANKIKMLAEDKLFYDKISKKGLLNSKKYSLDNVIDSYLTIYELLNKPRELKK
ncbi:glycosyltransferase family 4 protein [Ignatzschineria cameli]|nr:glycosyltransferase family 4 protein [Ignatzschineria cameli]